MRLIVDEGIVLGGDSIEVEEGAVGFSVEEERFNAVWQILLMVLGIHKHCVSQKFKRGRQRK